MRSTVNVRVSCAVDDWKIVTAFRACSEALREIVLEDMSMVKGGRGVRAL